MSDSERFKQIEHVTDTATWVAFYRAEESDRPDALFKDPYARKLIGDEGEAFSRAMSDTSAYVRQNVVTRTYIIDKFINELVHRGVDTVINLGAGLDTPPYRMNLPATLKWIEIDFPKVIETKSRKLANDQPRVNLERIALDLSDLEARKQTFARIGGETKRAVILTEGVLHYLSEEDVSMLAKHLLDVKTFEYWICDYVSPEAYRYLKSAQLRKQLKNAPMKFFPPDWFGFFTERGWLREEIQYIQKTTADLGRPMPAPLIAKLLKPFMPRSLRERFLKASGYMILKRT